MRSVTVDEHSSHSLKRSATQAGSEEALEASDRRLVGADWLHECGTGRALESRNIAPFGSRRSLGPWTQRDEWKCIFHQPRR